MSLYDDASLALLTGAGAGKDGKLYVTKPIAEFGNELITNGGFDTNTDWTFIGSASISGGAANFAASGDYLITSDDAIPLSVKQYRIEYEVISGNGGALRFAGGSSAFPTTTIPSTVGVHIVYATSNGTAGKLQFNSVGFIGSIDNVSVKEVLVNADFEFTRGSNLAATRVGADGLIEKGRENLLLQSNQFDTTWFNVRSTETGGQTDKDGGSTAWLLESTDASTSYVQQNVSSSGVQTFSVIAKKGTADYIYLLVFGSNLAGQYFDLNNGTLASSIYTTIDASIEDFGNGWYRCSLFFQSNVTHVTIYPADSGTSSLSAVGSNIYIQDAQLEVGLVATEYIESGASTGKAGLLEDEPRFDYSDGAACPSLLIESSRTQIIPYSEALLSYNQFKVIGSETTIDYTSGTTPEGITSSIATISETATTGNHRAFFEDIDPCTIGSTYSFSVFAKSIGGRNIRIGDGGKGFEADTIVDLSDGTVLTDVNNNVTVNAYGNGWYRISMSGTNNSIYATQRFFINSVDGTTLSFAGDVSKGVLLWGAQFEESDSPTSYIPNHSGASITRNRDYANGVANTAQIGDDIGKGTWLIDIKRAPGEANQSLFLAPKANLTQQIRLHFDLNGVMRFRDDRNGYATIGAGINTTDRTKLLVKVDTDGGIAKVFINGEQVGDTYVLGATPFEFGRIIIENRHYNLYSTVFFPEALTDVECIKLTEL